MVKTELTENNVLILEIDRPGRKVSKFEFQPDTEVIINGNVCILRKAAIHRIVTEESIEVGPPQIISQKDPTIVIRTAKYGDRVEHAIGESSELSLESEISQKYPIITADNRAYQRAVLQVIGLAGKVYGEDEIQRYGNNSATSDETTDIPASENSEGNASGTDAEEKKAASQEKKANKKQTKTSQYTEESYDAIPPEEEIPSKNEPKNNSSKETKGNIKQEKKPQFEEESYDAVISDEGNVPKNTSKSETESKKQSYSSQKAVNTQKSNVKTAVKRDKKTPLIHFEVKPEHTEQYPWLTQEAADDALTVDPDTFVINVGRCKGKGWTAREVKENDETAYAWLYKKSLASNEEYNDNIRACRAMVIRSLMEETNGN